MVVGAFPAAKLGALLLKQVSKPIANLVKSQAKSSPFFRKYVCMPPAHFYNWCEVKTKMWILNLGKPVHIPVLNEAMAIELGANLLGEGLIFIIAAGILISEYSRSAKKEAAKEEAKQQEMEQLQNTIKELFIQTEEQGAHIRELSRKFGYLETSLGNKGIQIDFPKNTQENFKSPSQENVKPISIVSSNPLIDHPSSDTVVVAPEVQLMTANKNISISAKTNGLIFKAVNDIENQFWNYPLIEREESIIMLSLYYLQKLFRF